MINNYCNIVHRFVESRILKSDSMETAIDQIIETNVKHLNNLSLFADGSEVKKRSIEIVHYTNLIIKIINSSNITDIELTPNQLLSLVKLKIRLTHDKVII